MEPARLTWRTIERIRVRSGLPIVLKGIATREDAALAVEAGIDAIYVSNHGGRQLDHAAGTLDTLPEIVEAVAGRAEVIIDGGICRGTDVLKADRARRESCLRRAPAMLGARRWWRSRARARHWRS